MFNLFPSKILMNSRLILDNIISNNYENLVDHIYDNINDIMTFTEQTAAYNYKTMTGTISEIGGFLSSEAMYSKNWLMTLRELILLLSRKDSLKLENYFNTVRVNNKYKLKLLMLYILFYHYDARSTEKQKLYVGIDFEFNQRKIALCQIAFFPLRRQKFIWVFDPNDLDDKMTSILISYLFTSRYIYKIVHGSDSLDIPYVFQELFMNNHEYIYSFTQNVIDTRFLCEYFKNTVNFKDKKCSLYDALLFFDTIDEKKYDELQHISQTMGPIQDVNWSVSNMSSFNLKYAAYDSLYLLDFYNNVHIKAKSETPDLYNAYRYIPLITRFIFLEKWGVSDLLVRIKTYVDPINNYIVKHDNQNITLVALFNSVISHMKLKNRANSVVIYIDNLLDVNYFRTPLMLLFKTIVYSIVSSKYDVFMNKSEPYTEQFDLSQIFDTFKIIRLHDLRKLAKTFYIAADIQIKNILQNM